MKAMILRNSAADAVQTAHILAAKGFQTLCVGSRDIAQAMISADTIDLLVMDERIGAQLTHTIALSAERRNPYVSTVIITDNGADETDDLYALIPSLYALMGVRTSADLLAQIVLCAVAGADTVARRIDRQIAADAIDLTDDDHDVDLLLADVLGMRTADVVAPAPSSPLPAFATIGATDRRSWGDFAALRPYPAITAGIGAPYGSGVKISA